MNNIHIISTCAALLLLAACSTTPRSTTFSGSYAGRAVRNSNPYGESLVEVLDITQRAGSYSLAAYMNATNREPGMDHTSNTRWQWTGTGTGTGTGSVQGDALAFTYSSPSGDRGAGSLRQEGTGLLLALDGHQYLLDRSLP